MDSYALAFPRPTELRDGMHDLYSEMLFPLGEGLTRASQHFGIPERFARPEALTRAEATHHPRGIEYPAPACFRAAAHAMSNPGCTLTGFGALALYGLPVLVEGRDITLISPSVARKRLATSTTPTLTREELRPGETWHVLCRGRPIRVAAPEVAVAHALREIRRGRVAWPVERTVHDEVFVRAVQLIDACRFFLNIPPADVETAAFSRIDDEWLRRVLKASSTKAESPKETEMRLIASAMARELGLRLEEQIPVFDGDRLVTTFDAGLPEEKIGYMFDGTHHWEKAQRVKDARINAEATALGWVPLRFADQCLNQLPEYTLMALEHRKLQKSGKTRRNRPKIA